MLSVNGALSWLHFQDLTARFEVQRARDPASAWLPKALALRSDFGLRLQALAGMLAALDSVGVSLFQSAAGNALLRQHFDSYWPVLQLDLGIDSLQLYAKDGPPLATWTTDALAELDQDAQVRAVIAQGAGDALDALPGGLHPVCRGTDPVGGSGRRGGGPGQFSGRCRGFLQSPVRRRSRRPDSEGGTGRRTADKNFLPRLGLQVIGLSSAERNLPLLQQVVAIPSLPGGGFGISAVSRWPAVRVVVSGSRCPDGAASPAMMVVIDDLTRTLAEIRSSVLNGLQGELLASLLSLLLLALLVHAPLKRMTRTAQAIPLLGRSAFAEARAHRSARAASGR